MTVREIPWRLVRAPGLSVDIAFGLVVAFAFVWLLRLTAETYFMGDDWGLLHQGISLRGMVEPYNDHLSVTILGVYRVLIEAFGFTYWPFRVAGLLCLMAIPVAFYLTTRRLLGPPLAAVAGLSFLSFSSVHPIPSALNHYLVLLGGIMCAWVLNRTGADWVLGLALALALSAAGGGLAVAVACVVHNAYSRAPMQRWMAVGIPCAAWVGWWLVMARGEPSKFRASPSSSEAARFARDLAAKPFEQLGGGVTLVAALIAVGFVVVGGRQVQRGEGATWLAWTAALIVWVVGLGVTRGGVDFAYRYQLVALGFVLLAVIPSEPIRWPHAVTEARWSLAAVGVIFVGAVAIHASIRDEVEERAARTEYLGTGVRQQIGEVRAMPGGTVLNDLWFGLRAADIRAILERYG